jgi:hypothetical protein
MQISFGKHSGKLAEEVAVRNGSYVKWVFGQSDAGAGLSRLCTELQRLVGKLDAKPIVGKCHGHNCSNQPVRFTAYWNNDSSLFSWCETCDPYSAGALQGKLYEFRSYGDALSHVELRCGGTQAGYDRMARSLAEKKGLPNRVGAAVAKKFFS